jgi:hypothetical protein
MKNTRPQPELFSRFRASRRSVFPFHPDTFLLLLGSLTSLDPLASAPAPGAAPLQAKTTPANIYLLSPHSICIGPAPAAPAASF